MIILGNSENQNSDVQESIALNQSRIFDSSVLEESKSEVMEKVKMLIKERKNLVQLLNQSYGQLQKIYSKISEMQSANNIQMTLFHDLMDLVLI